MLQKSIRERRSQCGITCGRTALLYPNPRHPIQQMLGIGADATDKNSNASNGHTYASNSNGHADAATEENENSGRLRIGQL